MYYIVYGLLYLLSLLPFSILYFLSDCIYGLVYYVFGYRKEIVMSNLALAFPTKTNEERIKIAKQFYKNFIDSFIETIKIFSISKSEFDKRTTGNFKVLNDLIAEGKSINLIGGHTFNWEYANLFVSKNLNIDVIGIYGKIENNVFNKIVLKLRTRFGTIMVATAEFQKKMVQLMQKQYCIYLLADQNAQPHNSVWIKFFGKPAPFIPGPFKSAMKRNTTIVFINHKKIKRGYYSINSEVVVQNAGQYTVQELTQKYRDFMEDIITRQPENYLWSHRRWKYNFDEHFDRHKGVMIQD